MDIINIPTEQTTALTDLVLSITGIFLSLMLIRFRTEEDEGRRYYWSLIFLLVGLAAGLGAVAHGIEMSDQMKGFVWLPLNLILGVAVSIFLAVLTLEIWGRMRARVILPLLILVGVVFFALTILIPGLFLIFVIYEGIAMILALVGFVYLSRKRGGSFYKLITGTIVLAIVLSVLFVIIQIMGDQVVTIFNREFDQNSFFHIVPTVMLVTLYLGIKAQLKGLEKRKK